jgi:hypothetical protein
MNRESVFHSDADGTQWYATRDDAGVRISRRTNVAHTRFAGTWEAVDAADAPPVVRAVVAVWNWREDNYPLSGCLTCQWRGEDVDWHAAVTGHETYRDATTAHFIRDGEATP